MLGYLLLALLLQVQLHLQGLSGLQEGLAMFPVSHVVRHDAHGDGTHVDHNVSQKLKDRGRQPNHSDIPGSVIVSQVC